MQSPQYVPINQAAKAFGVTPRKLHHLAKAGNLPEATLVAGQWLIPYEELPAIATREGFVLDLHSATNALHVPASDVEQYLSENVAAHAAVVLAKTQVAAARSETQRAAKEKQQLMHELNKGTQERITTEQYIKELKKYVEQLEHDQTELLERFDQMVDRMSNEKSTHLDLTARYQTVVVERDDLLISMDWVSRRRYHRLVLEREQLIETPQEQIEQV